MSGPRPQRGVVFPSPVVMISIVAVAMAAVAFVFTRHHEPTEQVITASSQQTRSDASPTASSTPGHARSARTARSGKGSATAGSKSGSKSSSTSGSGRPAKAKKKTPTINRSKTYVDVFNNSGISGLAATVGQRASDVGWNVVGADNWYGTIPSNTVYYSPRLKAAAKQLALDLGVARTAPAVDPMKMDRLTLILTAPLH